ncbi:hypothetical protein Y1Q_0014082 [Alligator mississippiensis]|uniref:Uncharacterized protein n=1 Tax=Alligator mississippiensis TaxID=8496 RepID=A0A151MJS6_ALLMI|nr:hypothetical protein Y1Q_0014082 [Alligator mississippiensis]
MRRGGREGEVRLFQPQSPCTWQPLLLPPPRARPPGADAGPRENPAVLTLGAGGTGASLSHGDLVGIAWKSFCPAGGYSAARALRDGGSPTPGLGIFNLPAHFFGASKVQGVLAQSALWDLLAYSLSLLATPEIGMY